jgi:succinate dehydrogenase / fumarate reductase, cytochrome b subunit
MTDVREALFVARTSDGRTVRRPLSPHLQVYKLPASGLQSISHRATGIALSVGALILVAWLVSAAASDDAFGYVSMLLHTWIGKLALMAWTASLWFHFSTGIRHLFWDAGRGFEIPTVQASSRFVLIATAVLTVLTWIVGFVAL